MNPESIVNAARDADAVIAAVGDKDFGHEITSIGAAAKLSSSKFATIPPTSNDLPLQSIS
jgi:hypothetical protein